MKYMEWLELEAKKPQYENLEAWQIVAYLNAPTIEEIPGEGTVMAVLETAEIMVLIQFSEWMAITSDAAMWKATAAAAIAANAEIAPAIMAVDTMLIRELSTTNVPLESAVMMVLNAGDVDLAIGLIQTLVAAGLLSAGSAMALEAAMEKPASSTWVHGLSIAQTAVGVTRQVAEGEIQAVLGLVEEI